MRFKLPFRAPKNPRRSAVIIVGIALFHGVLFYGFVTVRPTFSKAPALVYTSLYADPSTPAATFFVALPQMPCVDYQDKNALNAAPLPNCLAVRTPPADYQSMGKEGFILIDFTLDTEGRVISPNISKSSGSASLDQAALDQVRETWVFTPCAESEPSHCKQSLKFQWLQPTTVEPAKPGPPVTPKHNTP